MITTTTPLINNFNQTSDNNNDKIFNNYSPISLLPTTTNTNSTVYPTPSLSLTPTTSISNSISYSNVKSTSTTSFITPTNIDLSITQPMSITINRSFVEAGKSSSPNYPSTSLSKKDSSQLSPSSYFSSFLSTPSPSFRTTLTTSPWSTSYNHTQHSYNQNLSHRHSFSYNRDNDHHLSSQSLCHSHSLGSRLSTSYDEGSMTFPVSLSTSMAISRNYNSSTSTSNSDINLNASNNSDLSSSVTSEGLNLDTTSVTSSNSLAINTDGSFSVPLETESSNTKTLLSNLNIEFSSTHQLTTQDQNDEQQKH